MNAVAAFSVWFSHKLCADLSSARWCCCCCNIFLTGVYTRKRRRRRTRAKGAADGKDGRQGKHGEIDKIDTRRRRQRTRVGFAVARIGDKFLESKSRQLQVLGHLNGVADSPEVDEIVCRPTVCNR